MNSKIAIGQRIKAIRVNRNETLEEFAQSIKKQTNSKLKTNKSNVSKWEKGLNVPNDITLNAIAELGNVSINYLLEGKNNIVDMSEKEISDFIKELANQKINYSNTTTFTKSMIDLSDKKDLNTLQIEKKLKYPNASVKQINFLLSCERLIESNNIEKNSTIFSNLSQIINILTDTSIYADEDIANLKNAFTSIIDNVR